MDKGIIRLSRMFSYLEIKEDNSLHFQILTANFSHHSLKLLTLWRGELGFSILRFRPFFTSVFRFWCPLRFLFYYAIGFRFSAKIKSGFQISYSMRFGFFPVYFRKICASATSTSCNSCLILLQVFGFDRNLFRFCGFLILFAGFCCLLYQYSNAPSLYEPYFKKAWEFFC